MALLSGYFACQIVGTENTKSSSSKVSALVSGSVNRTAAIRVWIKKGLHWRKEYGECIPTHQAAYQLKAPWGPNTFKSDGNKMASTKL